MPITKVTDFIEKIKNVGFTPETENYFRGHSNHVFELIPGIYRDNQIKYEDKLFREIVLRVPQEFAGHKSAIENLVKMQHYGLPTRILDITSNPLVALYFSCCKDFNEDGEVIFMQIPKHYIKFYDSDTISVLANIPKQSYFFEIDGSATSISDFNTLEHIQYLLHSIKEEKPYFHDIINPKHIEEVYAVKVKLDNSRILKQNGAFLVFGIQSNKMNHAKVPYRWIQNKILPIDLIIPKDRKLSILHELDLIGINESHLFPEVEYQSKYLKEAIKNHWGPFL